MCCARNANSFRTMIFDTEFCRPFDIESTHVCHRVIRVQVNGEEKTCRRQPQLSMKNIANFRTTSINFSSILLIGDEDAHTSFYALADHFGKIDKRKKNDLVNGALSAQTKKRGCPCVVLQVTSLWESDAETERHGAH